MNLIIERLSPTRWVPPWIRHQHLARYECLAAHVAGARVIDAACGNGYGADILCDAGALEVVGFDCSTEAIAEALAAYDRPGLRFAVADVTRLPVANAACDAFVSLETIEHVADVDAFLAEVVRVLAPGGAFYCSTPNRQVTNPGITIDGRPFNRFHMREYTAAELQALLKEYFNTIEMYGQTFFSRDYCRFLSHIGKLAPRLSVRTHQARKLLGIPWERREWHQPRPLDDRDVPEVLIAVCRSSKVRCQRG